MAGVRVHIAPRSAEIDALKRRLEGLTNPRGGEIVHEGAKRAAEG